MAGLSPAMTMHGEPMVRGTLYGIGVGPGDPELVTLKAVRLLRAVAVVAYPAPDRGESFARAIVAEWIGPHQREIAIRFPMRPGAPPVAIYEAAADRLAGELEAGRDVALLCQGDAMLYGSFIPIFARLAPHHRVEIVPGVSSLAACGAAAGQPLATRDETLTVVPATLPEADLRRRLAAADAAAVIKIGRHLGKLRRVLDRLDLAGAAVYVERASLPVQRVAPLAAVDPEAAPYFSMVLVRRGGPF